MLNVVIVELPAAGTLYQAAFAPDADPSYSSIANAVPFEGLIALEADDDILADARGVVLFNPAANEYNESLYTQFKYAFQDAKTGLRSETATVKLSVRPTNDAPRGIPQNITCAADGSVIVGLEATDVDEDPSNPRTWKPSGYGHPFAYISTFPSYGLLSQVDDSGNTTTSMKKDDLPASTFSWASEVVRHSSQFSLCGSSCTTWASPDCDASAPGTSSSVSDPQWSEVIEYWGDGTCHESAWHSKQILGEADYYPDYGDNKLSWEPRSENFGHEWIELRFPQPMYINRIEIYETYKPGAV